MSSFDALESAMLDTSFALFGNPLTLIPMRAGPGGVNAVREEDPDRPRLDTVGIPAEFPAHIATSDNGVGRAAVRFSTGVAAQRHLVTLRADLPWTPKQFDRLVWHGRLDEEFQLTDPMPDGGSGITFAVNKL